MLASRLATFRQLERLYADFEALTELDATERFNARYAAMLAALGQYRDALAAVDGEARLPPVTATLTGQSATGIAGAFAFLEAQGHWKAVLEANAVIERALPDIIALYEADRRYFNSIRDNARRSRRYLLDMLLESGLVDPEPYVAETLAEITALVDARPAEGAVARILANERLREAVMGSRHLFDDHAERARETTEQATLRSLDTMLTAHRRLAAAPDQMRFDDVVAEVERLAAAVESLRTALASRTTKTNGGA